MPKVEFLSEATKDLQKLSENVKQEVKYYTKILGRNENFGKPLSRDLDRAYSIYMNNSKHRMVYTITKGVVKVVLILAIGKRENFEVYNIASSRMRKYNL